MRVRTRFRWATALGPLTDAGTLWLLRGAGLAWGDAQIASYGLGLAVLLGVGMLVRVESPVRRAPGRGWTFLLTALMALFVRGGLLAWLRLSAPAVILVLGAVAVTWLVLYALWGMWQTAGAAGESVSERGWIRILQGFTAYLVLLRLVYLQPIELLHEEAYYWLYAQHLDIGYLDHPPLVAWLIRLTTGVFGQTEFGVRAAAFALWPGTAAFLYGLTRRIFDRLTAWVAVSLLAVLPFYFGVGVVMTPDAPLVFCWAGAIYFAYRAFVDDDGRAALGLGLVLGLGLLTKYTIGLLGLGMLLFVLLDRDGRAWLRRWQTYAAIALALLIFSPVLVWNTHHDWASFTHQFGGRLCAPFRFSVHKLLGAMLFMLTPFGVVALASAIHRGVRGETRPSGRTFRLLVTLTVVPLAVLLLLSTCRSSKFNWTGPLWLAMLPYVANWTVCRIRAPGPIAGSRPRGWMVATALVLVVFMHGFGLYHLAVGWPGLPYPPNFSGTGWREVGARVEALAVEAERRDGERPLVVGMVGDVLTSWATFYRMQASGDATSARAVGETVGRHLFGEWSHMFEEWYPAEGLERRSLLLLGREREDLETYWIGTYVEEMGEIREIVHPKNGRVSGTYYYRWVHDYAWHPPVSR